LIFTMQSEPMKDLRRNALLVRGVSSKYRIEEEDVISSEKCAACVLQMGQALMISRVNTV